MNPVQSMALRLIYREPPEKAKRSFNQLMATGQKTVDVSGNADVAVARNESLTAALSLRKTEDEVLVLIDDDMVFDIEDYYRLVDACAKHDCAVSACYSMRGGQLCCMRAGDVWLSGLGFFAVPFRTLIVLAERSPFVSHGEDGFIGFTFSGPSGGEWIGSDYRLCQRLGGVKMLPWSVGHEKLAVLRPSTEQIRLALGTE